MKYHSYTELQRSIDKVGRRKTLLAMGDLNTTLSVVRDTDDWGNVFGRHGEEVRNESERGC